MEAQKTKERPIAICILSGDAECCEFEQCRLFSKCYPLATKGGYGSMIKSKPCGTCSEVEQYILRGDAPCFHPCEEWQEWRRKKDNHEVAKES